jgi:hypothetical protein
MVASKVPKTKDKCFHHDVPKMAIAPDYPLCSPYEAKITMIHDSPLVKLNRIPIRRLRFSRHDEALYN